MVTADQQKAAKVPAWQGVIAYFSRALDAVGAISKMGCVKHNKGVMPTKWRAYPVETYSDALARHIMEEGKGYLYDSESHMLHAGHAAWNALARLEKLLETHPLVEVPYAGLVERDSNSKRSSATAQVECEPSVRDDEAPHTQWGR